MQTISFRDQFVNIADACALAQSIVDTVREPVMVLDKGLRVVAASRSFDSTFKVRPEDTQGRLLYTLGDGQWNIPKLRVLLEKIIPEHGIMEGYEVAHNFHDLGHRTMYLNARQAARMRNQIDREAASYEESRFSTCEFEARTCPNRTMARPRLKSDEE